MILHPAIIALLFSSVIIAALLLYSSLIGVRILLRWDINSGSELQLVLERRTYLISTILAYAFGFQIISLFLYIYTADSIHHLFVGAMCAAGTLNLNSYGYPALLLKITTAILAGLWLILNHTDNQAYDYPLIKKKYALLLLLTPLFITELTLQTIFLLKLNPNVITSCCGSLFSSDAEGIAADLAALPSIPMKYAFYASMALTAGVGLYFILKGKLAKTFALLTGGTFLISIAAIISFISLYFYELPSHHCPFDILQGDYGYVGYPLYISLFTGAIAGTGTGLLALFRKIPSLQLTLPSIQKKLVLVTLTCFVIFTLIVTWQILFSNFILDGY